MKRVLSYYKKYIPLVCGIFVAIFGQVLCELALPTYMADIINNGIIAGDLSHIRSSGTIMIAVSVGALFFAAMTGLQASITAAKTSRAMRKDLFNKVTHFSTAEFQQYGTASLVTRSTNDIQQVQTATVMMMRMLLFAPIMGIGAVIMAFRTSISLSWTIGLALVCVLGLMIFAFAVVFPRFRVMQEKLDGINLIMKERLSGTLVVRAFRTEEHEEQRFDDANVELTRIYTFVNKCMAFMFPSMTLIMSGVGVLIVWVGAHMVEAQNLMVGDILAYLQYAMMVIMSFMFITMIFIMIPRAAVSAKRIGEVLDTEISIVDPEDDTPEHTKAGKVQFDHVSFKFPDADIDTLTDISFTANPGEVTAIIGGTGSGKSSLVNLIPRFYDVTGGKLLVDNVDVRDMKQTDLRDKVGLVPQKGTLFSGTIESNLRYGNEDATREELLEAAEIAQAMEFINDKPNGLDEEIAQAGTNVSGGQKQRLCIARALVKKPEILVFDDSFSALDFATDKALRAGLKENLEGTTLIIVAQRINTVLDADQIIVIDEGKMAGKGTHNELMESCSVYREIALSQLSEEELGRGDC